MGLSAIKLGAVFCAWGVLVAFCAVFGATRLKDRFGTSSSLIASLVFIAFLLALIGVLPDHRWVVIGAVIASGIPVGLNNTLITTAVMSVSPVPRNVASAAYGFVRFIGGGLAPYVAGKLVERFNAHVPFLLAALVVMGGRRSRGDSPSGARHGRHLRARRWSLR
jgi:predicted MFS family arabinose efflux permease